MVEKYKKQITAGIILLWLIIAALSTYAISYWLSIKGGN